jgi:hypothetical protein
MKSKYSDYMDPALRFAYFELNLDSYEFLTISIMHTNITRIKVGISITLASTSSISSAVSAIADNTITYSIVKWPSLF